MKINPVLLVEILVTGFLFLVSTALNASTLEYELNQIVCTVFRFIVKVRMENSIFTFSKVVHVLWFHSY